MALGIIPFRRRPQSRLSPRRLAGLLPTSKSGNKPRERWRPSLTLPREIRGRTRQLAGRLPVVRERQRRNRNRYLVPVLAASGVAGFLIAREVRARIREMDLEGRVVIITGGSRGLGFLLAREFLRQGAKVAICARDDEELFRAERELVAETGAQVLAYRCDVSDPTQVEQFVNLVSRRLGAPDVLVNNAGVIEVGPLESMEHDDFRQAMDVMFWGVLNPTLAVLPYMREKHSGRIVNITSIGGLVSVPHLLAYCSAKFAATGFSEGLRAELAGTGIRVTTVSPGVMRTGSHVNAQYKGHGRAEFRWFSVGAGAPVISMDAERAARQIVRAAKRGEAQRILSLPATVLARLHGVAPGLTTGIASLANRMLPSDGVSSRPFRGADLERSLDSRLYRTVTIWGRKAAERFQHHEPPAEAAAGADESEARSGAQKAGRVEEKPAPPQGEMASE
jgi:NAD(P)-dependent dehydrogenase (short-subunit alcohol dehydrogenase family)